MYEYVVILEYYYVCIRLLHRRQEMHLACMSTPNPSRCIWLCQIDLENGLHIGLCIICAVNELI